MPRPYPNGRRRRPGRRPPHRYSGHRGPPKSGGFTPGSLGSLYRVLLPGLRGTEKKRFFNDVSRGLPQGLGLGGALMGYSWLGPLGAAPGAGRRPGGRGLGCRAAAVLPPLSGPGGVPCNDGAYPEPPGGIPSWRTGGPPGPPGPRSLAFGRLAGGLQNLQKLPSWDL